MEDIERRVISVISTSLNTGDKTITPHSDLENDLGADSLDRIELIFALEEEFNVELNGELNSEYNMITKVDDVINKIQNCVQ